MPCCNPKLFLDFDDFTALVLAALGANAVGQHGLVAFGALGQTGALQVIVRAARGGALLGVASFWIWHFFIAQNGPDRRLSPPQAFALLP
jgi:hypothetical protein